MIWKNEKTTYVDRLTGEEVTKERFKNFENKELKETKTYNYDKTICYTKREWYGDNRNEQLKFTF